MLLAAWTPVAQWLYASDSSKESKFVKQTFQLYSRIDQYKTLRVRIPVGAAIAKVFFPAAAMLRFVTSIVATFS